MLNRGRSLRFGEAHLGKGEAICAASRTPLDGTTPAVWSWP